MNFAVTAIGRDRPGIVAAITGVLLDAGGNVDDSQMSILHGHFAVMLIANLPADGPEDPLLDGLRTDLDRIGSEFGLGGITVSPVAGLDRGAGPTHLLTVYGADRPGIVHDTARMLADLGINITDLRTRRTGPADTPLYTLMVEVSMPEAGDIESRLTDSLAELGAEGGIETRLSELDTEVL